MNKRLTLVIVILSIIFVIGCGANTTSQQDVSSSSEEDTINEENIAPSPDPKPDIETKIYGKETDYDYYIELSNGDKVGIYLPEELVVKENDGIYGLYVSDDIPSYGGTLIFKIDTGKPGDFAQKLSESNQEHIGTIYSQIGEFKVIVQDNPGDELDYKYTYRNFGDTYLSFEMPGYFLGRNFYHEVCSMFIDEGIVYDLLKKDAHVGLDFSSEYELTKESYLFTDMFKDDVAIETDTEKTETAGTNENSSSSSTDKKTSSPNLSDGVEQIYYCDVPDSGPNYPAHTIKIVFIGSKPVNGATVTVSNSYDDTEFCQNYPSFDNSVTFHNSGGTYTIVGSPENVTFWLEEYVGGMTGGFTSRVVWGKDGSISARDGLPIHK